MHKKLSAVKKYRVMLITFSVQLFLMALFHFSMVALLQEWLTIHGQGQSIIFWSLFFFCAIPLLSIGLMSSTFLALVAGYFLSWESLGYYIPTYIISAYIGYQVIAYIDKGKTLDLLSSSHRLKKVNTYLNQYPFSSVLFLRFSPVISFGQLTALCAFLKLHPTTYIIASTLGMLPRTILAIWCGILIHSQYANLTHYTFPENYTSFIVLLFILSLLGIVYTFKRSLSSPVKTI